MKKQSFKIGDVVQLWLGNRNMTVAGLVGNKYYDPSTGRLFQNGDVICTWVEDGREMRYNYPPRALTFGVNI